MFAFSKRSRLPVLLLGLLALFPASRPFADDGLPPPRNGGIYVVAHRGAHEGIPENTLPAYQKAIDLGCDYVEIDVRTTKDGRFVSVHNGDLSSYTNGQRKDKVRDLTLEELRAVDIGSRVGPEWKDVKIPTFEEILDLCKGRIGIYLDLKDAPVAPLVEAIRARGMDRDVIWYASPKKLGELQESCPTCIPMPDPGPVANLPDLLARFKPVVVATTMDDFTARFADLCHEAGAVVIMDESNPDCWKQALEWKVDGIQTDHPEQLIAFLKDRAAR